MFSKIKNYITENTGILIRVDDIAENMNWDLMEKSELLFEKYSIKPVLGVIPNNKDSELLTFPKKDKFWDQVRNWRNKGWEIAMHGYTHVYDKMCQRSDDYFNYGGESEFVKHSLEIQMSKIKNGLKKFEDEKIKIRAFFAPNHTFDENTIKACKAVGIDTIVDGYGLAPYYENGVFFLPQLFYRLLALPFGFQTLQIHLNYFDEKDFVKLEKFIKKNQKKIISFSDLDKPIKNSFFDKVTKYIIEKILKFIRKTRERFTPHKHHN